LESGGYAMQSPPMMIAGKELELVLAVGGNALESVPMTGGVKELDVDRKLSVPPGMVMDTPPALVEEVTLDGAGPTCKQMSDLSKSRCRLYRSTHLAPLPLLPWSPWTPYRSTHRTAHCSTVGRPETAGTPLHSPPAPLASDKSPPAGPQRPS
jgi:hypothetical protein